MDIEKAVAIVSGFLDTHIKKMAYFSDKTDHDRKLQLKSVAKSPDGKGVLVMFQVGRVWSIHDPAIRRTGRWCLEALRTAQPTLKDIEITPDYTQ